MNTMFLILTHTHIHTRAHGEERMNIEKSRVHSVCTLKLHELVQWSIALVVIVVMVADAAEASLLILHFTCIHYYYSSIGC